MKRWIELVSRFLMRPECRLLNVCPQALLELGFFYS